MTQPVPPPPPAPEATSDLYHDVGCVQLVVLSTKLDMLLGSPDLELQLSGGPREILFEGVQSVPAGGTVQELPPEGLPPQKPLPKSRIDNDPWVLECRMRRGGGEPTRVFVVVASDGRITTGTLVTPKEGGEPQPVVKTWPTIDDHLFRHVIGILTGNL